MGLVRMYGGLRRISLCNRHRPGYRHAVICMLLSWVSIAAPNASAEVENSVKAAFVFNFLRFTEWPAQRLASPDAALTLCVWSGSAQLSDSLRSLAGRKVDQHALSVSDIDRVEDLQRCHALFVPEAAQRKLPAGLLRRAESQDVLTMGDAEGFTAGGGMMGLLPEGARLRFEINDKAVKRSALRLSSHLYKLGRMTQENPSP
ncbi:YfiR family protein [Azohydromonas australica]|uniref:YfiR family protein n=1 Tax=Azohydromonas australica TaxID=364039 RepID=UPI0003F8B53F|nr:YfiR family protein [Azohydromonas australica]